LFASAVRVLATSVVLAPALAAARIIVLVTASGSHAVAAAVVFRPAFTATVVRRIKAATAAAVLLLLVPAAHTPQVAFVIPVWMTRRALCTTFFESCHCPFLRNCDE